jgi:cytochrome P450
MNPGSAPPYYDPYDAVIDADPYPVWKRLRDEAPLYYNERHDFYALSRFADVLAASLDWQSYSSARGTVLEAMDTTTASTADVGADDGYGMMIFMDPPRHDELRRLVSRAFTRVASPRSSRVRASCAHGFSIRNSTEAASTTSRTSRRRSRQWSSERCSACPTAIRTSCASGVTR